jgi:ketosteroid isomerase-like protein
MVTDRTDLGHVLEEQHAALDAFAKGDHLPLGELWSQTDDVTLGNPFGPFARGFADIMATMERAAGFYRDGRAVGFETVGEYVGEDIAVIVEVERFEAKMGGSSDTTPLGLRCTSVFRRDGGDWRLVHRHADPIMSARGPESVLER